MFLEARLSVQFGPDAVCPYALNEDAFAACLIGRKALNHRVIYFSSEECFYFFEPDLDAYVATTHDKLATLASNLMIQCAQACGRSTEILNLFVKFREPKLLKRVVEKAESILLADDEFFSGSNGAKRIIRGRMVLPTDEPCSRQFANSTLMTDNRSQLAEEEAYAAYIKFCKARKFNPLSRGTFRGALSGEIMDEFNVGIRHDIIGSNGKACRGWKGVRLVGSKSEPNEATIESDRENEAMFRLIERGLISAN